MLTRDLWSLNLLAELIVLHCQILFSLAVAAIANTILDRATAAQVLFLQRVAPQLHETGHLLSLLAVHPSICTDVVRAVGHDLALFCADFLSICRCSVYESVDEAFKFTIAAAHKIDVVGKS